MRVRIGAVILAGALAGIGGAYLALETSQFVKNMSAGRGFIALAAVIFGKWRPGGAAAACLFFGLAEAVQIRLQGAGLPTQFVQMIPYGLTMVALAGFVGRSRPPASLVRFSHNGRSCLPVRRSSPGERPPPALPRPARRPRTSRG